MIAVLGGTDAAQPDRQRPVALVRIGLAARPGFQDGDGPVANIVIEPRKYAGDGWRLALGRTAGEDRLKDADEEERLKEVRLALVREQIGMVLVIGRQDFEEELEHAFGLADVAKCPSAAGGERS